MKHENTNQGANEKTIIDKKKAKKLPSFSLSENQYLEMCRKLKSGNRECLETREEYTLFKEVLSIDHLTEPSNYRQEVDAQNSVFSTVEGSGVKTPLWNPNTLNDTSFNNTLNVDFLAPIDIQKTDSISNMLSSFKSIQSDEIRLNIGFDTEFQTHKNETDQNRNLLSLQMSIVIGNVLIRYFFLVSPEFQEITASGGLIPLKYCLSDILNDLKSCYFPEFPTIRKDKLIFKEKTRNNQEKIKVLDFKAMKDKIIPITLISHTGKADISVFRRSKYDVDLLRYLGEIQGGWMTKTNINLKAEVDNTYNYYWLINLCIRDTLGLSPNKSKSLKELGNFIKHPIIELSSDVIENMAAFAVQYPFDYYNYAMKDSDIVILYCTELFRCNHAIPMTLSTASAIAMRNNIKEYFNITKDSDYDRIYRGLELVDNGLIASDENSPKFLKSTRLVPIRGNPDAKLIMSDFAEAYVGGFNTSFHIGWIIERPSILICKMHILQQWPIFSISILRKG